MKYLAYLAGPITGCSFDECVDWREYMIKKLPSEIVGLSPMRGKTYLEDVEKIADSYDHSAGQGFGVIKQTSVSHLSHVMSCMRGITTRDFNDCRRSDVIVVNLLGAEKVSIGTVMEIAWAKAFNIPLVLIMEEKGNVHEHAMVNECTGFRVKTCDEAIDVATMLLLPYPHKEI
ncbi:MAG: hypothetical protein DWQ19_10965 [Crenarchaeota archaeon]|nr:MAG: hypothetical protein DWQ19_10965 [Thermoproteota archaeon]